MRGRGRSGDSERLHRHSAEVDDTGDGDLARWEGWQEKWPSAEGALQSEERHEKG